MIKEYLEIKECPYCKSEQYHIWREKDSDIYEKECLDCGLHYTKFILKEN